MKLTTNILFFILGISIELFLFTIFFSYYDKKTHEDLFIEKALSISNSFESSLNEDILNNRELLFQIITKYKYTHPELKSIEIINGRIEKQNIKINKNNNEKFLIIEIPLEFSGEIRSIIQLIFTMENIDKIIKQKRIILFLLYFINILIIYSIISFYAKNSIISPINNLLSEIEQIKKGNELKKSKITYDEIGILKKAIYDMHEEILLSKKKIEEHEKELEKKIAEKTKELQEKVKELERFQQITVNREMDMIELKKKLKELEKKELEKSKK